MSVLLDTNILLRLSQQIHPQHAYAKTIIAALKRKNTVLHVVPQNIYEFWSVATRPIGAANGLGLSTVQCKTELDRVCKSFVMLPDIPAIYGEWERLVELHDVKGKTAHDARLVAAMNIHNVSQILTFNASDFSRFGNISVMNPLTSKL